jgi:hypothetical protein
MKSKLIAERIWMRAGAKIKSHRSQRWLSPHTLGGGDELYKGCRCFQAFAMSHGGQQYRQAAKTRTWSVAEERKHEIEARFRAADPTQPIDAVKLRIADQQNDRAGGTQDFGSINAAEINRMNKVRGLPDPASCRLSEGDQTRKALYESFRDWQRTQLNLL